MWNSVRTELRVTAATIVCAFHDTRRPIDELVCSTDASTGEGEDSPSRHGGYGVTSRHFEPGWFGTLLDVARDHSAARLPSGVSITFEFVGAVILRNLHTGNVLFWMVERSRRRSLSGKSGFDARGSPQMSRTACPWQVTTHTV